MNAAYVYLMASSCFFLLSWIVLLLVAYALAFQGDVAQETGVARAPRPRLLTLTLTDEELDARGRGRPRHTARAKAAI